MSPTIYGETTPSERMLKALHPAFAWLARRAPSAFGPPDPLPPHPSAMLEEHNWAWRMTFPRFFDRIGVDTAAVEKLREAAKTSTLVYVAKDAGQLEYHYFNHLFRREGLPLARYTNALTLRRWMRWGAYWDSIFAQEAEIGEHGRTLDPLADGRLAGMLASGESVLLALSPSGLLDDGLFFTGPSRALAALIEAQRQSQRPISIIPLDFVWSRRPESAERTLVDILFGEKENPGAVRKIALFWRNYKQKAQAAIGDPIDLSTFISWEGGDDARLAKRLRDSLLTAFKAKRRTITGPPIRPRRWFVNELMGDDALDSTICRIAADMGKPADDLRELAASYAREIPANLDHTTIELLDRVLGRAFNRIFDNFQIDEAGLERAKGLYAEGPIVFVPNHKSHADYLILSHILYHRGMTVPHIAAGINLEFWPLGPIFRRGGAFFIRRAFRDNPLYKAVLSAYLKVLLKEGYSQEFFIEGGRSRTGKLMKPRKGMLTMLNEAAGLAGVKNLRFIPVSITYDRVIEQKSYERELEGATKEKERTSSLLGLTKFLRRPRTRYGSIYVRFGEPVAAAPGETDSAAIEEIAYRICHEINRNAVVTPTAVAACALLAGARRGVTREIFDRNWKMLLAYIETKGVAVSKRIGADPQRAAVEAAAILTQARLVVQRDDAVVPFFAVEESGRVPLSLYKNGIVHFFTTIGVVSALLIKRGSCGKSSSLEELTADFEDAKRLLAHEFRFATSRALDQHIGRAVDFLIAQGGATRLDDGRISVRGEGAWVCELFASQVIPFAETLMTAFRHVTERMKDAEEERTLISRLMATGHDMLLLEYVRYREAITKAGFENALRALASAGLLFVQEPQAGTKRRTVYAQSQESETALKLKAELEKIL